MPRTIDRDGSVKVRELVTEKANQLHDAFLSELDRHLADAFAKGVNLAVSEFEFEPVPTRPDLKPAAKLSVTFLELKPGEMPPRGRAWTIYSSSADRAG